MSTFTWLGGDLGNSSSWSQPDPMNPVEPGAGDDVILNMDGTLTGSVSPDFATLTGTFTITTGVISTNLGIDITNGSVTQTGGSLSGPSSGLQLGGSSGAVTYVQNGGNDSYNFIEFNSGSYELDSGMLTVGSTNEYIADNQSYTASFVQKGGTHTVNGYLLVGYTATGSYDLQGGTLSTQIDYIGQNGKGTFTQEGGTQTVSDRIVLGIDQNSGMPQLGNGAYTLGGTGSLSVQTIFIGSDPNCTGAFTFNDNMGDAATLTVSGTGGFPGLIVGGEGRGTFTLGAGNVSTTVAVGYRSTGAGTFFLDHGKLTSTDEEVAVAGKGSLYALGADTVTGKGLIVGVMAGSQGDFHCSNGATLQAVSETIGSSGTGELGQDMGSSNTVNKSDLIVGYAAGSKGSFYFFGGTTTVTNGNLIFGAQANSSGIAKLNPIKGEDGNIIVSKGSLTVGDAGTGTVTLGGGAIEAASEIIGNTGTGTFNQTMASGANSVTELNLIVGDGAGGNGTYNFQNGKLTISLGNLIVGAQKNSTGAFNYNTTSYNSAAGNATLSLKQGSITVGDLGTGVFTMDRGILSTGLTLGSQAGGEGTFTLNGGSLTASGVDEIVGDAGSGKFVQTAGGNSISDGTLIIGNSGTGTFMLSGGTVTLTGTTAATKLGVDAKSSGTLTIGAAKLTTPSLTIGKAGTGHVTVNASGIIAVANTITIASGSTLKLAQGSVNIGSGLSSRTGTVSIGTGGSLAGAGTITGAVSEITTGSVQAIGGVLTLAGPVSGGGTLSIANGATLDLAGNDANTVEFLGNAGTLRLEKTAAVTGKIAQPKIGDVIDIAGIVVSKASLSGSTLTLDKSGGGTIKLTLTGSFTGDKFVVQSDSHGGSNILLQKSSAATPGLGLFGQYVAAGFGNPDAAHDVTAPVVPPSAAHPDLAHGHA